MAELRLNVVIGGVEKSISTVNELEQALRQTKEELKGVAIGSDAFERLSAQAQNLQREFVNSFKETTNFQKGIAELGQSVGSVASTITAGFTIATTAFQLFGSESEELTQAQIKAQQALALALSATTIATNSKTLAEDLGNIATALGINLTRQQTTAEATETAVKGAQTVATEGATVAQLGLNAAMLANPITLLLGGLTLLVGAILLFSDSEETAKTNVEDTTAALLERLEVQQRQADDLSKLAKLQAELYINEAKNEEERTKRRREVNDRLFEFDKKALENSAKQAEDANKTALDEASKFTKLYVREREVLVRSVAQFDEFGIFIGYAEEYRTITEEIGADVLQKLKDRNSEAVQNTKNRFSEEQKILQDQKKKGEITETEFSERTKLIKLQETSQLQNLQNDYYIQYLKDQARFLSQSTEADDKTKAENLQKTITALTQTSNEYRKYYNNLIQLQLQNIKQQQEEENKEAERQREAAARAAEKARQDRQKQVDANKEFLKRARDDEEQNEFELRKIRIEAGQEIIKEGDRRLGAKEAILKLETEAEIANINEILAERIKEINSTKALSTAKKNALIAEAKSATQGEIDAINELFNARRQAAIKEDEAAAVEAQNRAAKLKAINDILNQELIFGDQDTLDSRESLLVRQREIAVRELDAEAERETTSLQRFIEIQNERAQQIQAINEFQEKLDIENIKRENERRQKSLAENLQKEFNLRADFSTKVLAEVTALTETEVFLEIKALEAKKETLSDEERARLALLQSRRNGEEQVNVEIQEITQKYADERVKIEEEAEDKILSKKLSAFNEIFDNVKKATAVLQSEVTQPYFTVLDTIQQGITSFTELQDQEFSSLFEQIAAYAGAALQVVQGVITAISQANQAALAEELAIYQETRDAEADALTRQLNSGLITRQQYDDAIKDLDKDLQKEQTKAKKKAFEEEKKLKIAQAIIAGLQGAVSAFAGAMQLGPIAGPIVGGILAGAVAALTALQVSMISKTKFDSPAEVPNDTPSVNINTGQDFQQQAGSTGGFTQFNSALTGTPQGGGTTTTGQGMTDTRVYVLESDISAVQRRVQVAESTATFG